VNFIYFYSNLSNQPKQLQPIAFHKDPEDSSVGEVITFSTNGTEPLDFHKQKNEVEPCCDLNIYVLPPNTYIDNPQDRSVGRWGIWEVIRS
jgi:hypothetical protein